MHIKFLILTLMTILSSTSCYDMILGDKIKRTMVHHERIKTYALPFVKRVKTVSYKDPHKRTIKGIAVIDRDFSEASANVTAGGVGSDFVSIRLKSQRSQPLNYDVEIYA